MAQGLVGANVGSASGRVGVHDPGRVMDYSRTACRGSASERGLLCKVASDIHIGICQVYLSQ
jgi:hypothetical protein